MTGFELTKLKMLSGNSPKLIHSLKIVFFILFLFQIGCSTLPQYNSQDLSVLPCEFNGRFFFPIEFDKDGNRLFEDQVEPIVSHLQDKKPKNIYIFIHGWDKTASSAEKDYQELICRFYHKVSGKPEIEESHMVIGVFWDSTVFQNISDPFLLKWATYFSIRSRAEILAKTGFVDLLELMQKNILVDPASNPKLFLIGHSFGGRIVIKGLLEFLFPLDAQSYVFFSKINEFQVILLNAAVSESSIVAKGVIGFPWGNEDMATPLKKIFMNQEVQPSPSKQSSIGIRMLWDPGILGLSLITDFRIFNVYSEKDYANRFLYPLGAIFNFDSIRCAIGGCGMEVFETLRVSAGGNLIDQPNFQLENVYNVDASQVIHGHSDIYKGRVANLLSEMVLTEGSTERPKEASVSEAEPNHKNTIFLGNRFYLSEHSLLSEMVTSRMNIEHKTLDEITEFKQLNPDEFSKFVETAFQLDQLLAESNWALAITKLQDLLSLAEAGVNVPYWKIVVGIKEPFPEHINAHGFGVRSGYDLLGLLNLKLGRIAEAQEAYELANAKWGFDNEKSLKILDQHPQLFPFRNCFIVEEFANFILDGCPSSDKEIESDWFNFKIPTKLLFL